MKSVSSHVGVATKHGSCGWKGCGRRAAPDTGQRGLCSGLRSAFWAAALAVMLMAGSVRAADFVIVVDVSGSMAERVSRQDKRVRVTVVQEALRQYLPALPSGSRVDLIAFNSGIVSDQEVILKDENELARALAWVDDLAKEARRDKETYLWTTLRRALQTASRYSQENPDQPVTVRVLTDGQDNERATTLDNVLQEFLPVLDGEKIRSNLVLLGDMEFKTKWSLPEGAFETTKNPTWEVLFPPIVLWAPTAPVVGEEVRLFENNTKSIYKEYEWQVDGTAVGNEKVLAWQFTEPRSYRVTLKVTGLQGTKNSATVLVRAKERDKLVVDFVASSAHPEPQQEVKFMGRCNYPGSTFSWFVNSNQVAVTQDLSFRFDKEGKYEVKLVACDAAGSSGVRTQTIQVKEQALTVSIKGPAEIVSGRSAQFAGEITGPCASVEWDFGDGTTSVERNPEHTFHWKDSEFKDLAVSVLAVSPLGKAVASVPHAVRVWAEKKAPAPHARFRVLTQHPKVGQPIQVVDETTGPVESVQWDVDGEPKGSNRNPEIVVSTPGEKTFRMTVRGPGGESVATRTVLVDPQYSQPVVRCGASRLHGTAPVMVQFTNVITGDFASLLWQFGDGQSSTNSSPSHTFATGTNYVVSLTVFPMDRLQSSVEKRIVIKVAKPWPLRAKAIAVAVPSLLLLGAVVGAFLQRRRNALRMLVYCWADQEPASRTIVLTKVGETSLLSPTAPLRIQREGASRSLSVRPLEGAVLVNADGQEVAVVNVGDGVRVTVRDAAGQSRAVAISALQKPLRPGPATTEELPIPDATVCGVHTKSDDAILPSDQSDFDWGLDAAPTKVG